MHFSDWLESFFLPRIPKIQLKTSTKKFSCRIDCYLDRRNHLGRQPGMPFLLFHDPVSSWIRCYLRSVKVAGRATRSTSILRLAPKTAISPACIFFQRTFQFLAIGCCNFNRMLNVISQCPCFQCGMIVEIASNGTLYG
jgi:hypothetical protein